MSGVVDAVVTAQRAFRAAGLKPPAAIVLASREDGMRLLTAIREEPFMVVDPARPLGAPVEHPDGSVWMEVQVSGTAVRWPAHGRALPGGDFRWW